jgi:hypothetical protein
METITIQDRKTYYKAKGYVYGHLWGGEEGIYPSEVLYGDDIDKLKDEIKEKIEDGSLDSGMGYQKLVGALIEITKYEDIVINDNVYTNKSYSLEYFGDLNELQQEFLESQMFG